MNVLKSFNQLLEHIFSNIFLESSSFSHVVQQISSRAHFNNEQDVFLCLKSFKKSNYTRMFQFLQNVDFLHDFSLLRILFQKSFIDRFDGYKLFCESMHGQIYFSKRSFTKYLSNSVKLCGCIRSLSSFHECQLNVLRKFSFLL